MTRTRGILFDSADVLVGPATASQAPSAEAWRRWFPGPRFEEIVRGYHADLDLRSLDHALARGMEYLDLCHRQGLHSLDAERDMFQGFYRIVLNVLGVPAPSPTMVQELARAKVDEERLEPFVEVPSVLERLRARGLRLGVLSESWPSLIPKYERVGLRHFFDVFIISAQEARLKDDPMLFAIARARMDLPAPAIMFVDDWPLHVETAVLQGFRGVVVARERDVPILPGLLYVKDLVEMENLLAAEQAPGKPT